MTLAELEKKVELLTAHIFMLMAGSTALNKRCEMLEALAMTTSRLAGTSATLISQHMADLRRASDTMDEEKAAPSKKDDAHEGMEVR